NCRASLALRRDHKGPDGARQVLHALLTDILELQCELAGSLLAHGLRHADSARRREALQPGRDVHAVAKELAVLVQDVRKGDADAEMHPSVGWKILIAQAGGFLDLDPAAHRVDRARELGQHPASHPVYDASPKARGL